MYLLLVRGFAMVALNQIVVKWIVSKSEIKIQYKKGINGTFLILNDQFGCRVTGYTEITTDEGIPPISYNPSNTNMFYPVILREESTYLLTLLVPGKITSIQSDFINWPFIDPYVNQFVTLYPKNYWREKEIGNKHFVEVIGEINTKNFVGILNLSLSEKEHFYCEVAAKKLSYEEDYKLLLNDIAKESSNLIMQIGGLSKLKFISSKNLSDNFSRIINLRSIMEELPVAIETINMLMHSRLESVSYNIPLGKVKKPDIRSIITSPGRLELVKGGVIREKFNGYSPQKLIETESVETKDTPENQYVKNFLEELHILCSSILKSLEETIRKDTKNKIYDIYIYELKSWLLILENYLDSPVFRNISKMTFFPSNSQVLQNRAGYQDIFIMDQRLQSGIDLIWNPIEAITNDTYIRPIYDLYEIWCFFALRKILRNILGTELKWESNVCSRSNSKVNFNLKKGNSSYIVYKNKDKEIVLFYNKVFKRNSRSDKSYSITFRPDFSVYVSKIDKIQKGLYIHFDSKYRIDESTNEDEIKTYKKDDIVKMHAYKDGIYNTLGSFILYPGNEKKIYRESSALLPSVGVFPFKPNNSSDHNNLALFIKKALEEMYKKLDYGEISNFNK
jgi:hypothetical protein